MSAYIIWKDGKELYRVAGTRRDADQIIDDAGITLARKLTIEPRTGMHRRWTSRSWWREFSRRSDA